MIPIQEASLQIRKKKKKKPPLSFVKEKQIILEMCFLVELEGISGKLPIVQAKVCNLLLTVFIVGKNTHKLGPQRKGLEVSVKRLLFHSLNL